MVEEGVYYAGFNDRISVSEISEECPDGNLEHNATYLGKTARLANRKGK